MIAEESTNDILYYNKAVASSRRNAQPLESDIEFASLQQNKPDLPTMMAEYDEKRFAKIDKTVFLTQPIDVCGTIKKIDDANELYSIQDIIRSVDSNQDS